MNFKYKRKYPSKSKNLVFERREDTKYKSVCNSEDFQQRGANFLD